MLTLVGATRGTSLRYLAIAITTPINTATKAIVVTTTGWKRSACSTSWLLTTGASQETKRFPLESRNPEATDPIAKIAIGPHIKKGDSCGCAFSSQRFAPVKVRIITRVI